MKYDKYIIKKNKTDLLSSLKALDNKIIKGKLKAWSLNSVDELKQDIIDSFKFCLISSKTDFATILYFKKLLKNENTDIFSVYKDDIDALWCFVYEKDNYISYYIADEIKDIIRKELNIK